MKKLILILCCCIYFFGNIHAQEDLYTLEYAKCNELISSPYIADLESLGETKCVLITQEETDISILLSESEIYLESEQISQELSKILTKEYYRGEKLFIKLNGTFKTLENNHSNIQKTPSQIGLSTLEKGYSIQVLEDVAFTHYETLSKFCSARSFSIGCDDESYSEIQTKVSNIFNDIFLKGDQLFSKSNSQLEAEKQKIQTTRAKFQQLKSTYTQSSKIIFLLESIDYRLSIYQSLIENTLGENQNNTLLSEKFSQTKGYYQKHLRDDTFLYKGDLFQYIYYKNALVNTSKLDTSHFDFQEIKKQQLDNATKQEIFSLLSQRYSLGNLTEDFLNDYVLIHKQWFQGPTSILASTDGKRFIISGKPKNFQEKGNYIYFESYTQNDNFFMIGRFSGDTRVEELFRVKSNNERIVSYTINERILEIVIVNQKGEYKTSYKEI